MTLLWHAAIPCPFDLQMHMPMYLDPLSCCINNKIWNIGKLFSEHPIFSDTNSVIFFLALLLTIGKQWILCFKINLIKNISCKIPPGYKKDLPNVPIVWLLTHKTKYMNYHFYLIEINNLKSKVDKKAMIMNRYKFEYYWYFTWR